MRKAFLAALTVGLFLLSAPAWAQISMVHVTACGPATFPGTACTIPATGSGNLIVVGVDLGGGVNTSITVSSVTDNAANTGNTYVAASAARAIDTAVGSVAEIWYAKNSLPGATSLNITFSTSVSNAGVMIWEFSGIDRVAPLDQAAALNSQPSTGTPSGAAVTTTSVTGVVVSHAILATSATGIHSGNAFINDSTLKANGWAHLITSSAGTYAAQWDQSPAGTYGSSTASFKAAGAVTSSSCDLNNDGTVNDTDVTLARNMTVGLVTPCTANVTSPGVCDAVVVQRVVNASMGGFCVTGSGVVALSSVSCGPSTLISGGLSTCTVTLSNAATSNTAVALSSNNGSLTVPGSVTVASGQLTATFSATAGTLSANGSAIVTATLGGVSSTATITLSAPTPHSVTLSWTASTSTGVTGYNIYRGTVSTGPYTKLTSSPVAALTYTDNGVVAGQTYYYVATTVAGSAESVYSSPAIQAVIPTP